MAGLTEVPVVIRELTDREAAELALIENLQRQDLNPMEEAYGFRTLMEQYGLTQEETAKAVNKSRPAVANALRLLNLPGELAALVENGSLSAGHARALLSFDTPQEQAAAAKEAIRKELSVRALEKMAKESRSRGGSKAVAHRDSLFDEVELALTECLGRKVRVINKGDNGVLQIEFYGKEDLQTIANQVAAE
jgi:ParB family chromosome partitioning protein